MKDKLNILIVGRGGRESALAAKILESPRCQRLYSIPSDINGATRLNIGVLDFDMMAEAVETCGIDMVVVGPEAPVVEGIRDALAPTGVKVIAPDSQCARLEGSKEFAKEFMLRHAIPSPRYMSVTADTIDEGMSFLDSLNPPYVVKADGLAAGRGTYISSNIADAKDMLSEMLNGLFGESSETVLIEEYVKGKECSVFLAVDGEDYIFLPSARDYKRFEEGDRGLNTAGLGSISPAPAATPEFIETVERRIVIPTLKGLKEEGMDYQGILYLGLIEADSEPLVLEYNVRLGDPESQVVLPRIKSDIIDLFEGIADRTLSLKRVAVSPLAAAGVVIAASGYPGFPVKGDEITGIEAAEEEGLMVYTGAVRRDGEKLITDGGRIATVVALAPTLHDAAEKALEGAELINFNDKYFRTDIGELI